jgi:hypothetical protein
MFEEWILLPWACPSGGPENFTSHFLPIHVLASKRNPFVHHLVTTRKKEEHTLEGSIVAASITS